MTDTSPAKPAHKDMPAGAFIGILVLLALCIGVAVVMVRQEVFYLSLLPGIFGFLTLNAAFSKRTLVAVAPWSVLLVASAAVVAIFFS
jgi:hypothetical protein